jgi:cytosine/adenosine deaminase-related metal-dependent hydrolase
MNNSVGRAPVLAFGERSALGTDGIDGDMFAESRTAYFRARDDNLGAYAEQFTDLLARGGNLVSEVFGDRIGALAGGARADLVVLNYDPPTPLTSDNLAWHWMFALTPHHVESVMVEGEWVIKKGEFCTVDEEKIRAEARREATCLWQRMDTL